MNFGGLRPNVSDVIYSTMGLNPYRKLAIVEDLNESTLARLLVGEGGRSNELDSISDSDSVQMRELKQLVSDSMIRWAKRATKA